MKFTQKDVEVLKVLLGRPAHLTLECLSSEFSEGQEDEFKNNYGITSKQALKTLKKFN